MEPPRPSRLYGDHAAGSPVRADVIDAMLPFMTDAFGNPSSVHSHGTTARRALNAARASIAASLGADPDEVAFTTGGTESGNLAVKGIALAAVRTPNANSPYRSHGPLPQRILISACDHPAVLESARWMERWFDFEVLTIPVDDQAHIDLSALSRMAAHGACLACLPWANSEVGTIEPVAEAVRICHAAGIPVHVDAVQAAGTISVDFHAVGADSLSVSGHKFGAPRSTGAWLVRRDLVVEPLLSGGGQENGLRPGTENVAGCVALAVALDDATTEMRSVNPDLATARDSLIHAVLTSIPQARLTGDPIHRLPGHASFVIPGIEAETLLVDLDVHGIECSSGTACAVGHHEIPPTLLAMGISPDDARGALRISFRRPPQPQDIGLIAGCLEESCARLGLPHADRPTQCCADALLNGSDGEPPSPPTTE
jgi:cysteine desulfurase